MGVSWVQKRPPSPRNSPQLNVALAQADAELAASAAASDGVGGKAPGGAGTAESGNPARSFSERRARFLKPVPCGLDALTVLPIPFAVFGAPQASSGWQENSMRVVRGKASVLTPWLIGSLEQALSDPPLVYMCYHASEGDVEVGQ